MEIRTIIHNDSERLLIVDRECCLVYTGDAPGEPRPFIRVGTWKGMPPALIPMIDTIILPEGIEGNPAHERFNIDVRDPRNNHYIGLSHTIQGFVEFQRFMGVDPDEISVTIVEKDLPAIPGELPAIPGDDYIGVFTRDGNVALAREGKTIFDLRSLRECPLRPDAFMTSMNERFSKSGRYAGSGLLIAGGSPLFYSAGSMIAVSPPAECLEDLSRLCVDPLAVTTFVDPDGRIDGMAQFIRWRHREGGSLAIFSDYRGLPALTGLFPGCSLDIRPFSGMDFNAGGIGLRGQKASPGLRVSFETPNGSVTAALVTDIRHAAEIMRKPADLVLVPAAAFEGLNLVLRGSPAPVAVFDDRSPVASRIHTRGITALAGCMQYEIVRPESRAAFERLCGLAPGLIGKLRRGETVPDDEIAANAPGGRNGALMNMAAILKIEVDTVTDRIASMRLTALLDILNSRIDRRAFRAESHSLKVLLCVVGGSLYQVAAPVESAGAVYVIDSVGPLSRHDRDRLPPDVVFWHDRILTDRDRLAELMRIHAPSSGTPAAPARLEAPARTEGFGSKSTMPSRGSSVSKKNKILKAAAIIAAAIAVTGGSLAAFFLGRPGPAVRHRGIPAVESSELENKWGMHNDTYGISVDDNTIYRYANQVAVANGYLKIAPYRFKEKNPAWIYPDTVFVLPDGQKVRISGGDTLWNLSRNKLIEAGVLFDSAIRGARRARGKERDELLDRAGRYAFTDDRKKKLSILREWSKKKGRRGK